MLINRMRNMKPSPHETSHIHNYYERMVNDSILDTDPRAQHDFDYLADVSCVALNHLPPRYIRYDVDMNFFLSPIERQEIQKKVQDAVNHAINFVKQHEQEKLAQSLEHTANNNQATDDTQPTDPR